MEIIFSIRLDKLSNEKQVLDLKKKWFNKILILGQVVLSLSILCWPFVQFIWMVLLRDQEVTFKEATAFILITLLMSMVTFLHLQFYKRKTKILLVQLIFLILSVTIIEFFWLGSIADIFTNNRQRNLIMIRNVGTLMNSITIPYLIYTMHKWIRVRKESKTKFGI